jgi:hypothetical protein
MRRLPVNDGNREPVPEEGEQRPEARDASDAAAAAWLQTS